MANHVNYINKKKMEKYTVIRRSLIVHYIGTKRSEINGTFIQEISIKMKSVFEACKIAGARLRNKRVYVLVITRRTYVPIIGVPSKITFPVRRIHALGDLRVFLWKFSPRFLDSMRFRWYVNIHSTYAQGSLQLTATMFP